MINCIVGVPDGYEGEEVGWRVQALLQSSLALNEQFSNQSINLSINKLIKTDEVGGEGGGWSRL